jgi:hypothetical protein
MSAILKKEIEQVTEYAQLLTESFNNGDLQNNILEMPAFEQVTAVKLISTLDIQNADAKSETPTQLLGKCQLSGIRLSEFLDPQRDAFKAAMAVSSGVVKEQVVIKGVFATSTTAAAPITTDATTAAPTTAAPTSTETPTTTAAPSTTATAAPATTAAPSTTTTAAPITTTAAPATTTAAPATITAAPITTTAAPTTARRLRRQLVGGAEGLPAGDILVEFAITFEHDERDANTDIDPSPEVLSAPAIAAIAISCSLVTLGLVALIIVFVKRKLGAKRIGVVASKGVLVSTKEEHAKRAHAKIKIITPYISN